MGTFAFVHQEYAKTKPGSRNAILLFFGLMCRGVIIEEERMANKSDPAITKLLEQMAAGEGDAREKLFQSLYPKLRELAENALRRERPGHTLQPTALVHEASLRLLNSKLLQESGNRLSFLAAASRAMREVLVDHARARGAQKRPTGDQRERVPLDVVLDLLEESHGVDLVSLADCLNDLNSLSPRKHEIVTLHFFGGMTFKDIAQHLDVSLSTVEKDWHFSRAWMQRALGADPATGSQ